MARFANEPLFHKSRFWIGWAARDGTPINQAHANHFRPKSLHLTEPGSLLFRTLLSGVVCHVCHELDRCGRRGTQSRETRYCSIASNVITAPGMLTNWYWQTRLGSSDFQGPLMRLSAAAAIAKSAVTRQGHVDRSARGR